MQNTFIVREFSYEDHQSMYGVIDEVVFCLKDWSSQHSEHQDCVTIKQAMILMKFAHAFDV
jgi:hypothetical protein